MTYLAHVAVSPKRFHFNRDFFVVVQKGTQRGSSYLYGRIIYNEQRCERHQLGVERARGP